MWNPETSALIICTYLQVGVESLTNCASGHSGQPYDTIKAQLGAISTIVSGIFFIFQTDQKMGFSTLWLYWSIKVRYSCACRVSQGTTGVLWMKRIMYQLVYHSTKVIALMWLHDTNIIAMEYLEKTKWQWAFMARVQVQLIGRFAGLWNESEIMMFYGKDI